MKKKRTRATRRLTSWFRIVLFLILFLVVIAGGILLYQNSHPRIDLSASLVDVLEIDEFSTSSFIYNGIADIRGDDGEKILCSAVYHATVKAGVHMSDVHFEVDASTKTVRILLPDISILSISVDPSYINLIPRKSDIELSKLLSMCREDVKTEASSSDELLSTAHKNLKSAIEALTLPLIQNSGYTIEW